MLVHIQIRDFAIIDAVELELGPGLTVLTGETGAGKSILVDALLLAAGGRAGAEVVRHGAERAEISATFTLSNNAAASAWLAEQSVAHEGECQLRRIIGADGRSRAYVNGQAMPIQALRQLGESLIDIHGQMEYQSLVRRPAQRELLDQSGEHREQVAAVAQHWRERATVQQERDRRAATAQDRNARLDLLRHHLHELRALEMKDGEVEALTSERQRLSQHERLAGGAREIMSLLRETEAVNAEQAMSRALTLARSLAELDASFASISTLIEESLIALREGIDAVARYESDLEADPQRQEWVEQRLAAIESIARKHRVDAGALPSCQVQLDDELQQLETLEASLEQIDQQLAAADRRFRAACVALTDARRSAAQRL
jgi:DNA repair protein RecN (Recombination protein N)